MIVLDENDEKERSKEGKERNLELFVDPPPLYLASGDPSTSQNKPLPRIPPPPQLTSSNHLDIVRSEVPIKGSWTIDTSLQLPQLTRSNSEPKLLDDPSNSKPNLRLLTHQGGVDAVVRVRGGRRAIIEATSFDGPVALTIVEREETSFCARIVAFQGDVLIRLPHSFYGPIKCKSRKVDSNLSLNTGHALPIFSPSMQMQLVALSSIQESNSSFEESSFFLGDLTDQSTSLHDEESWTADEIIVELDCRDRAYFFWADESTDITTEENNLLETVLTRLRPLHDVLRKSWTSRTRRRDSSEP